MLVQDALVGHTFALGMGPEIMIITIPRTGSSGSRVGWCSKGWERSSMWGRERRAMDPRGKDPPVFPWK